MNKRISPANLWSLDLLLALYFFDAFNIFRCFNGPPFYLMRILKQFSYYTETVNFMANIQWMNWNNCNRTRYAFIVCWSFNDDVFNYLDIGIYCFEVLPVQMINCKRIAWNFVEKEKRKKLLGNDLTTH